MLEIGSLVDGKYRILDEVGRGGMSVVYLARNIRTNKQWAIKEVRKDGTNDFDIVRANLVAETDILKKLEHPNLPNIIDILDDGESFIIIMDFIEGNSLQHYLKHAGAQSEEDVVQWGIQLCDVLGYLHSRTPPIIYRDMKPANVMLKPDGNISLIDFGTAREYKETSVEDTKCLGTQGYAAPEQYGGHGQTDARTDIYCLGATLYHLVTGHNPAEPPYEMYPIRQWNPALSEGLEYIILKCTQKNPDDRFQSCEELMYALQHRDAFDAEVRKEQQHKIVLTAISLLLTIIFAAGFFVMLHLEKSEQAASYDALIKQAASEGTLDSAKDDYAQAVQLNPGKADAYQQFLTQTIGTYSPNVLEDQELKAMQSLLTGNSSDTKTNMEKFKATSPKEYYQFCYDFGIVCFALYDGSNYNLPQTYLKEAMEATDGLNTAQITLAGNIYDMCTLYNAGTSTDMTLAGSTNSDQKTFAEYWKDIEEIAGSDLDTVFAGLDIVQVKTLNFIMGLISQDAGSFCADGVTKDQIRTVAEKMQAAVQAVCEKHADDETYKTELSNSNANYEAINAKLETIK